MPHNPLLHPLIQNNLVPSDIVFLDFETYYDSEYTLSNKEYNLSEYVRDEKFQAHGVGIKIGNEPARWVPGHDVAKELGKIDWQNKALVAHNTQFDGFILTEVYGIRPALYLDTLAMARGAMGHSSRHSLKEVAKLLNVGAKEIEALEDSKGKRTLTEAEEQALASYCLNDVELCAKIFWKLYSYIPNKELQLIHMTNRMFCEPVLELNKELLLELVEKESTGKRIAIEECGVPRETLASNEKFAIFLRECGVEPPTKISKTTGKETYAFAKTDEGFKQLSGHENARVRSAVSARLLTRSTISETRAGRFLAAADGGSCKLPVALNYSGAHTHRWSGGNKLNLQNLKKKSALRTSIQAPDGMVLVVCDAGQIEARITAWLASETDLLRGFSLPKEEFDIYRSFAAKIYKKPESEITDMERFVGKTCILGLGFGMGADKLKSTLALGNNGPSVYISLEDAKEYVKIYRSEFASIKALWRKLNDTIPLMMAGTNYEHKCLKFGKGHVRLPNGLFLHYPLLSYAGLVGVENEEPDTIVFKTVRGYSKLYGGLFLENIAQALARVYIAECMLHIDTRYRVVTMTHDEIVCLAPENKADEAYKFVHDVMVTPPTWAPDLPLKAEGGYDKCYSK